MWTKVAIVLCVLAAVWASTAFSSNGPKQDATISQRVHRLEVRSAKQATRITNLQNQLNAFQKLICDWSPAC